MDPEKDRQIMAEIGKWVKLNPNCVPVNFIVNQSDQSKIPDQMPILLFQKSSPVKDLVQKMKDKFPQYPNVYLFGKDQTKVEKSLKQKRKERGNMSGDYQGQAVIKIDEELGNIKVEEAFQRFKSPEGMLVVVVSEKQLISDKTIEPQGLELAIPSKESVLCGLIFLVAVFYLFIVSYSDGGSSSPPESFQL